MSLRSALAQAKPALSRLAWRANLFGMGQAVQNRIHGAGHIRLLNYHHTHARDAAAFEAQLDFFERAFVPATVEDLDSCMAGTWRSERPGLILTFDDGYRSNYDVAAPLLESRGMRGFFFIPCGFIDDTRAQADERFAADAGGESEPRMSWEECRDLRRRGHLIGCHTRSHVRLSDELSAERLKDEIVAAREEMERKLDAPVEDFCWVGGEEWSYGKRAYEIILAAGYRRVFMTNYLPVTPGTAPSWIQRSNIEADWPLEQAALYLSGLLDLAYKGKRRRLDRKLRNEGRAVAA